MTPARRARRAHLAQPHIASRHLRICLMMALAQQASDAPFPLTPFPAEVLTRLGQSLQEATNTLRALRVAYKQ